MKKVFSAEEIECEMANVRVINEIEGIIIDEKTEAAGRRILSAQTTVEEEMERLFEAG